MKLDKIDLMKLWGDKCKDLSSHFIKVDETEIELTLKDSFNPSIIEDILILLESENDYFFNMIVDNRNYFIPITQSEYEIMYNEVEKWFERKEKDDYKTFYSRWINKDE